VASAVIEMDGPRLIQFDFQQTDAVSMNVLWAKA
jgi:hypothetical protein